MGSSKTTIGREIFKRSIAIAFVMSIVFGLLFSSILYHNELSHAKAIIHQRNQAITYFINGYFTKFHNTIEFLSSNPNIVNATHISPKQRDKIRSLYQSLQDSDPDINYIYSGYTDGSLLINNYTPPPGFDSTVRPWYVAALKAQPNASGGVPYQEIKSREWLISISKVLQGTDGIIQGVAAIDCAIDKIAALLRQNDANYKSSYSFATDARGKVIIHHDNKCLNHSINEVLNRSVDMTNPTGELDFSNNGVSRLAYFNNVNRVGWIIVTVVDKYEILQPVINKIIIIICIVTGLAVLVGWVLSASLSQKIITPLEELKHRVGYLLANDDSRTSEYVYPDNEIGNIAADIEKFTEQELYKKNLQLQNTNQELLHLSTTDQLTRLFNRRKMDSALASEFERARRYKQPFSLIMFDVDFFKAVNDSFGHQTGDFVLIGIADILRKTLRTTDIVGRWGGDEFLILCPQTSRNGALVMAENIRLATAERQFNIPQKITLSIGITTVSGKDTVAEMLKEVDKKLYTAKHQGRNTVVS